MKTGILLTNIGSPTAATPEAVKLYLKKFLSDRRVVEIPKIIWWPILYGFILPFRSKSSAKLYQKIWQAEGSPLTIFSKKLATKLADELKMPVAIGMHYGDPSIQDALNDLFEKKIDNIIVLPLYPQYSASTTASTFDAIAAHLKNVRNIPALRFIKDYADHPAYINAIATSIRNSWQTEKPDHLLFSFHGLPKIFSEKGDPYPERCALTAALVAKALELPENFWSISFQSRLGRAEWLSPYTDNVLKGLPQQGKAKIDVICPGFAVDCLETLEEIAIRGKEQFLENGGKSFRYIPALNETDVHIFTIKQILGV